MRGPNVFKAGLALMGVVTLGLACGNSAGKPAGSGSAGSTVIGGKAGSSVPPITCPRCDGGMVAPTRCMLSETATLIDAQTARDLGFGGQLDLLEDDVTRPFQWSAGRTTNGDPAQGYTPMTSIRVRTIVGDIEHLVPGNGGCPDLLRVAVHTSLSTADGALDIEGDLPSVFERMEPAPEANGSIDLAASRGALMIFPARSDVPLASYVFTSIRFWPEGVRGFLAVEARKASELHTDALSYSYRPLEGRWPIDDCMSSQHALAPDEPNATPDGRSVTALVADLQRMLDAGPKSGTWTDTGAPATVAVHVTAPTNVCIEVRTGPAATNVGYRVKLEVTTSDGRVRVSGDAVASAQFDGKVFSRGYFEIYRDAVIRAQDFESASGVSGVDFGVLPAGFWHTEIHWGENGEPGITGHVVVEGVEPKGSVAGVIASFDWP